MALLLPRPQLPACLKQRDKAERAQGPLGSHAESKLTSCGTLGKLCNLFKPWSVPWLVEHSYSYLLYMVVWIT